MIRRTALLVLALSLVASLSALAAEPSAAPGICPGKSVDETSPEVRKLLAGSQSIRALGDPVVQRFENRSVQSQMFEILDSQGTPVKVKVDCNSGGCIAGCLVTGCNPTTVNNEPACTAVQCVNSQGGLPCVSQTTCSKSVTAQEPVSGGDTSDPGSR